jgi:hypothetical protein
VAHIRNSRAGLVVRATDATSHGSALELAARRSRILSGNGVAAQTARIGKRSRQS